MEKSAENDEPTPAKRSTRRRLVQSTLFPQKSQEIGTDQKADKDCEVDGDNEDDQDYSCGSQGKKTRKRKSKTASPAAKAPKKLKEKSPKKTTPKNNGQISNNAMESEDASPAAIPNLRLEAKLIAEENSRMFAGKQVHPFFSSWKAGKRNQDVNGVESNCGSVQRKHKKVTVGPIHVFERSQEDVMSIDWRNWMFYKEPAVNSTCYPEVAISSVFDGSFESLKFDKFSSVPRQYNASSNQCCIEEHLNETPSEVPVVLVDDQEECCKLFSGSHVGHQLDETACFSEHAGSVRKSNFEEKSSFPQECSRVMSYCNGYGNQPEDSLWTYKYRPKTAMEVCGNSESVKFISEWLHSWRERDIRAIKDSCGSDRSSIPTSNDDCFVTDSDSENTDEGNSLKSVLLVKGPVGSGKSAAICACANEKGFQVLENNASDCRLGTVVKQKFGEALESHCLDRSLGNLLDSSDKDIAKSTQTICSGEAAQKVDDEVFKGIHMSDEKNSEGLMGKSVNNVCRKKTANDKGADVKSLILFEDADIFFPEDRGFIAAIQQIAEKARGPVILTSNSNKITLPDSLNKLEVSFTMPTPKELLSHLYTICAAEKVNLQPHFLEQLIGCCQADIRKTVMHLQFWCQNNRHGRDKKERKIPGSELFDPEAGHQALPRIIPWDFPSQLSELVDKEIIKSLSLMEENSTLREVVDTEGHDKLPFGQDMHNNLTDIVQAKKGEILNRNSSVCTGYEFADPFGTACELSNLPPTPVSFSRRNVQRKFNVVTSSDSDDEHFCNGSTEVAERDTNNELFSEDRIRFPSQFLNMQNCISPSVDKLHHCEADTLEENHYQCSEVVKDLCINGKYKSVDISCVPESLFVPETEFDNGVESLCGTVCGGYVAETPEVSVANMFDLNLPPVEADDNSVVVLHESPDMLDNICNITAESSHMEEVEDSQNEHAEAASRRYQVMDECSRVDFKRSSKSVEEELQTWEATDLVRGSWRKLRGSKTDLKQYVTSEEVDAFQNVKLANGMCKLVSDVDLLLSKCQTLDFSELSTFLHESSDAFNWHDEHLQMACTIGEHGFCMYAKDISTRRLKINSNSKTNLTWEMLACANNVTAQGKLFEQDLDASGISHGGSEILLEREMKSGLFNRIKSIVPRKFLLALRGNAFHEYLSSLSCISRSEASRLSEIINKTNRRRARGSRHYLSTGALMLSPEDISLLVQSNLYGRRRVHPNLKW